MSTLNEKMIAVLNTREELLKNIAEEQNRFIEEVSDGVIEALDELIRKHPTHKNYSIDLRKISDKIANPYDIFQNLRNKISEEIIDIRYDGYWIIFYVI